MNIIYTVGGFASIVLLTGIFLNREPPTNDTTYRQISNPIDSDISDVSDVSGVSAASDEISATDLDREETDEKMHLSMGLKSKLHVESEVKKVYLHPGGRESLEIELDVTNQFEKTAKIMVGIEMVDALGKAVASSNNDKKPTESAAETSQQRRFVTPADLDDGAYVIRAAIAGRDADGQESTRTHEIFVLVDEKKMKRVTFDEWFEHANEGVPVLEAPSTESKAHPSQD